MISSPLGRCIIHRGLSVTRLLTLDSLSSTKTIGLRAAFTNTLDREVNPQRVKRHILPRAQLLALGVLKQKKTYPSDRKCDSFQKIVSA